MVTFKYIMILICLIHVELASAQYYEMGKRRLLDSQNFAEAYCGLYLQKDKYYILLTEGTSELSVGFFLSYGWVYKKDNIYYLKDIPSNASIVLELDKNASNLLIRKGFSFMQNECFLYKEDIIDDELESIVDIETMSIRKKERSLLSKKNPPSFLYPLRLGVYKNESITLFLNRDHFYQLSYHFGEYSQIVSNGKWIKEGNLLKLQDTFLDYSFTALVDSSKITALDFPNDVYLDYDYLPVEEKMLPFMVK